MPKKEISIKEIAELAGTSTATVSRVIHGNGRFSKETEARVLAIIQEYNYRPNALAQALRQDRAKLIGVMIPDITQAFFAEIFRSIQLKLYSLGYIAVLCDSNENEALEELYMTCLQNMRFSGLIYVGGRDQNVGGMAPATVYVDRYPAGTSADSPVYYVGSDNFRGGYIAAERLIAAGRTKPAIVMFGRQLSTQQQRYDGFCSALRDHGISPEECHVANVDEVSFRSGQLITETLCSDTVPCDSVFYSSDILALGGMQYLNEHRIKVPEDMSIIGMDDIPLSTIMGLTTIRQQTQKLGQLAAESVVKLINEEAVDQMQILDVELVERGSV